MSAEQILKWVFLLVVFIVAVVVVFKLLDILAAA